MKMHALTPVIILHSLVCPDILSLSQQLNAGLGLQVYDGSHISEAQALRFLGHQISWVSD